MLSMHSCCSQAEKTGPKYLCAQLAQLMCSPHAKLQHPHIHTLNTCPATLMLLCITRWTAAQAVGAWGGTRPHAAYPECAFLPGSGADMPPTPAASSAPRAWAQAAAHEPSRAWRAACNSAFVWAAWLGPWELLWGPCSKQEGTRQMCWKICGLANTRPWQPLCRVVACLNLCRLKLERVAQTWAAARQLGAFPLTCLPACPLLPRPPSCRSATPLPWPARCMATGPGCSGCWGPCRCSRKGPPRPMTVASLRRHGPLKRLAAALQTLRLPCPHRDCLLGRHQPLVRPCPALPPLQQRRLHW